MSESLLARRDRLLGPNMSTFYDEPVHLVRGEGAWVWDASGRKYLDCYNNVPHVGHCHPAVVDAICTQAATLNTHTRYLHDNILDYAEALTAEFADPISTAIFTCTGSEANDIALRMATAATGNTGIIATDHTYHGNTAAVAQLSRTNPPPGGAGDHIAFVPAPDSYRPLGGVSGAPHAQAFAKAIEIQISELKKRGHNLAALIIDPFFANEGFPDLPTGWLDPAIAVVRAAGGVIIADEVQPGFGRLGSHMWGHERMGFLPEIITIGKPMANGHPVGAVLTSSELNSIFRTSFRYFNTFAGNPVSCAAALATLKVVKDQRLMENAEIVGKYALSGLRDLATRHPCIAPPRGAGLFFGIELVLDQTAKKPATNFTKRIANAMRERGVLLNFLGVHYNVLKMRPPLVFNTENVDLMLATLDDALSETSLE